MKFFYFKLSEAEKAKKSIQDDGQDYFNAKTIKRIPLYEATKLEIQSWKLGDPDMQDIWFVYDTYAPYGMSNEPKSCIDIHDAYGFLQEAENLAINEFIHDL